MNITKLDQLGPQSILDLVKKHPLFDKVLESNQVYVASTSVGLNAEERKKEAELRTYRGLLAWAKVSTALVTAGYDGEIPHVALIELGVTAPITHDWKVVCMPSIAGLTEKDIGIMVNEGEQTVAVLPKILAEKVASGEMELITVEDTPENATKIAAMEGKVASSRTLH